MVFAEEQQAQISLFGVRTDALRRDIVKTWSTSRIESNMFTSFGRSRISFPAFFAPDIHFILQTLAESSRGSRINQRHLKDAVDALEKSTWLSKITQPLSSKLNRSKLSKFYKKPLPHQEEFFSIYDRNTQAYGLRGYLLSARAGSGKTLTNLMLAEMLDADHVIIVSPNNAVENVWAKTLRDDYHHPESYWVAGRDRAYRQERFLITHYEGLGETYRAARDLKGKVVIVLDECHNLNDIGALRTQLFIKLCADTRASDIVWSSGTPIKAMGYEAIPLLTTIDPLFTPDVEERFRKIFGREAKRALDILRNRMGMITYKVEGLAVENHVTDIDLKVKIPNGERYTLDAIAQEMKQFIEERRRFYKDNFKHSRFMSARYAPLHNAMRLTSTRTTSLPSVVVMIRSCIKPRLRIVTTMNSRSSFLRYRRCYVKDSNPIVASSSTWS